jgi:gp18
MTEPNILSQLFGVSIIFIGIFAIMIFTCRYEDKQKEKSTIIVEEAEDFREVARRNLKKCDRKSTYDTQPPIGLSSTIDGLPSDLKMCVEDYDRLANDYQEEARNNDSLREQNASLLQENGRLLYKEMTMDFRKNQRKWGARA